MFPSSHVVSKVSQRPAKRWGHQVRACEDHWLLGRGEGGRGEGGGESVHKFVCVCVCMCV